jgi:hypothetical protein
MGAKTSCVPTHNSPRRGSKTHLVFNVGNNKTQGRDIISKDRCFFLACQIFHGTNIAIEAMDFLDFSFLRIISPHNSLTGHMGCQLFGSTSWSTSHSFTLDHIRIVNQHLKRRCEAVSCTRLQSLHSSQLGHPLLSILSAVHILFWMTSQAKKSSFGGAHVFQTKDVTRRTCLSKNIAFCKRT